MKKRHKWNIQTDKNNPDAICLVCGIKKESLGKHFGVIYYFNENWMVYYKTPPCFSDVNAERLCEEWYLKK